MTEEHKKHDISPSNPAQKIKTQMEDIQYKGMSLLSLTPLWRLT